MDSLLPPFKAVIPARYASTRLPGKPLLDLGGQPMVVRVAERARAAGAEEVWVAVDHPDVEAAVKAAGFAVLRTREDHPSGTDRLAEVAARLGWAADTRVVNVQGDEPLIDPALIRQAVAQLADSGADIATLAHPIADPGEFFNPNVCKVVLDHQGDALLFSRAPIPYARDAFAHAKGGIPPSLPGGLPALRHIGLYAYRAGFLAAYTALAPSPLEGFESLEQLRALWHGYRISVAVVDALPAPGVDTPEDAERVRAHYCSAV